MQNYWTVTKSRSRKYGYALLASVKQTYLYDGYRMGWYKYKYAAQRRADELNKSAGVML